MTRPQTRTVLLVVLAGALLVVAFWVSPWNDADDWNTFVQAARRMTTTDLNLYDTPVTADYYANPPWIAAALIPATWIPLKLGWALLCAASLAVALLVLRRWTPAPGVIRMLAVLGSPPMFYILVHGQIDAVLVGAVLLPAWLWPLAAITKPQITIGLILGVPRRLWLRAALITGAVLAISFLIWGFWPPDMLYQASRFSDTGRNLWAGLWPFQVPLGIMLLALGVSRKDSRFLIASSPFLSPYAAMSSFIGAWIAAVTFLKPWQVALVWASWWGAVVFRLVA